MMLLLEFAIETIHIKPYVGVVCSVTGSLSFLFLDYLEGNANVSADIKSSSTAPSPKGQIWEFF